jgi:hypothetical protein
MAGNGHEAATYKPAVPPKTYCHSSANPPSGNSSNNKPDFFQREATAAATDAERGNPKREKVGAQNKQFALRPAPVVSDNISNGGTPHGSTNTHRQQYQHQRFPTPTPRNPQFSHWSAVPEPLRLVRGGGQNENENEHKNENQTPKHSYGQSESQGKSQSQSRADNTHLTKPDLGSKAGSYSNPIFGSNPYGRIHAHAHATTTSSAWLNLTESNSLGYISPIRNIIGGGSGGGVGDGRVNGPRAPQAAFLAKEKEKRVSSYTPYRPPTYCQDNNNSGRAGGGGGGGGGGPDIPTIRVERPE